MLSSNKLRPVLATHDENMTSNRRLIPTKKTGLQQTATDASLVAKTPAAKSTRRALGDISNRKVTLAPSTANAKPTATKLPGAAKRSSMAATSLKTARPLTLPGPPLFDDEIEAPAGRTWAQQQRDDSFDSITSLDADDSRIRWDIFFQDMERINEERQRQEEDNMMKDLDEHVKRVLDLEDMDLAEMKTVPSAMNLSFFPQYSDDEKDEGYFPVGLDISF